MTQAEQARARLDAALAALDTEDALGAGAAKAVEHDKCAVGRLSRVDEIQAMAMARAGQARRAAGRKRIAAALARLAAGEYGYCTRCGAPIEPGRLAFEPAVPTCIGCARG